MPCDLINLYLLYFEPNERMHYDNKWNCFLRDDILCGDTKQSVGFIKLAITKYDNLIRTKKLCNYAIKKGNLNALILLREHNYSWNVASVCNDAVKHKHLNILKWAYEYGCPWDNNTLDYDD